MMRPYVSTTALSGSLPSVLATFDVIGIDRVELSYCGDSSVDLSALVETYDFEYVAHNYFRPVSDEFIVNLASDTDAVRNRSITYIQRCLDFCADHGIDVFTFHAGFRVDPDLSLDFSVETPTSRAEALDYFFESLGPIRRRARELGVQIAVENNVVTAENVHEGESKLLFARLSNVAEFLERLPDDVGVLLDMGHLNVSATTFDFDRRQFVLAVAPRVEWVHLHDNDGISDDHAIPRRGEWPVSVYERALGKNIPATIESSFENKTDLQLYLDNNW